MADVTINENKEAAEPVSKNFIEREIDKDLAEGVYDHVQTRFPPEPNGYLHIGHAKSILLNYGLAKEYGGKFNFRFDDTNPEKEKTEFVESIIEDVKWLGADFEDRMFFASDYFQTMYDCAVLLIKKGKSELCLHVSRNERQQIFVVLSCKGITQQPFVDVGSVEQRRDIVGMTVQYVVVLVFSIFPLLQLYVKRSLTQTQVCGVREIR